MSTFERNDRTRRATAALVPMLIVSIFAGIAIRSSQAAASAPPTWSIVPSPNSTTSLNVLTGVSCTTASFCMAVGYTAGDATLAEAWNGSAWTVSPSANAVGAQDVLNGVSCVGASFCMGVGFVIGAGPLGEVWNGSSWMLTSSPVAGAPNTNGSFRSVSCVSTTFCMAVGDGFGSDSLAEIWNGVTWRLASETVGSPNGLNAVSCVTTGFCIAVGFETPGGVGSLTLIEQWNGIAWGIASSVNTGPASDLDNLMGVSCTSTSSCLAAGQSSAAGVAGLSEAWDGATWKLVPIPGSAITGGSSALFGLSCATPAFCESVGNATATAPPFSMLADEWNGSIWSSTATTPTGPLDVDTAMGVSCLSTGFCMAVGDYAPGQGSNVLTLIEERQGSAPPAEGNYAALGDSFSAGFGDGAYGWNSDVSQPYVNLCYRSANAYGPVLDGELGLGSFAFNACSGAVTDDFFHSNHEGNYLSLGTLEPPQLCDAPGADPCPLGATPAVTAATRVVTLTIGGNDAGFADVLENCVQAQVGSVHHGGACVSRNPSLLAETVRRINALGGGSSDTTPEGIPIRPLSSILAAIHAAAPNAHVYFAGYPTLFGSNFTRDCVVGTIHLTLSTATNATIGAVDAHKLNQLGRALDSVIKSATQLAGPWVTYVDPQPTFDHHRFCDTSLSWFNPVDYFVIGKVLNVGAFHPTALGQNGGYAAAFINAGL